MVKVTTQITAVDKTNRASGQMLHWLIKKQSTASKSAFSQSKEISSDLCCFYGGGVSHNEDIMHSFQKFIVVSFPTTLPL